MRASRLVKQIIVIAALPSAIIAAPVSSGAAPLLRGAWRTLRPDVLWAGGAHCAAMFALAAGGLLKSIYLPLVLFVTRISLSEDKYRAVCKLVKVHRRK